MKEIIEKIINNTQMTIGELNQFIVNVTDLFGRQQPTPVDLQNIVQLIRTHQFDLLYAVKLSCIKLDIPLTILYDKNGQIIKYYIENESN